MENKTKTADLSVRAAFALIQGVVIAMSYPLLYFMLPAYVQTSPALFLFLVLPILSFGSSMLMNWFLQYMYCGSVSASGISIAASMSPLITFLFMTFVYFFSFLRSPIASLFPQMPQENPEEAVFTRDVWGYAFYLFWAGVYGQTIGSGMIAACPSK